MATLESMFKSEKNAKCLVCQEPIPSCNYKQGKNCMFPKENEEIGFCYALPRRCPLALCYTCRLDLRWEVEMLNRMDKVLTAEAEEILKRPYARSFIQEPDGKFSTEMPELPGCISCGGFPANAFFLSDGLYDAYQRLHEAALGWIVATIESGEEIPKPEMEGRS